MKQEKINIDSFETNLGKVNLTLSTSPNPLISTSNPLTLVETKGHLIEIIAFDDMKTWWQNTDFPIESSMGWIVRVLKTNRAKEKIAIQCLLTPKDEAVVSEIDSGEHLDALWIENETEIVSIGTEDGYVMKNRAEREDWMPNRFKEELGFDFSFTQYLDFGLETKFPKLNKNEKIYFHYLVATDKRRKSKDYPDEDDISTTFAVDASKSYLIEKLKIKEEIR